MNTEQESRASDVGELNQRQIRFLRFHAEAPEPNRWAWQRNGGEAFGPPETWDSLRAWKRVGSGTRTAAVSADELHGLHACWTMFPQLSDLGRAAIAKAEQQP